MFLMFVFLPSVSAGDAGRGREEERREEAISEEQDGEFRPQTDTNRETCYDAEKLSGPFPLVRIS